MRRMLLALFAVLLMAPFCAAQTTGGTATAVRSGPTLPSFAKVGTVFILTSSATHPAGLYTCANPSGCSAFASWSAGGTVYTLSGNGSEVATTNITPGNAPGTLMCDDGNGNVGETNCSGIGNSLAEGQGMYIFTGARDDNMCTEFFVSADGIQEPRAFFWPLAPGASTALYNTNCDAPLHVAPGYTFATRPISALFIAPWNGQYYLAQFSDVNQPSTTFWIDTSPSLVSPSRWTNAATITLTSAMVVGAGGLPVPGWPDSPGGTPGSKASVFGIGITMAPASMCPAQDYTCAHLIIQGATMSPSIGSNGYFFYGNGDATYWLLEMHPLNSALTSWSNATVVLVGGDTRMMYYNNQYLLFEKNVLSGDDDFTVCQGYNTSLNAHGEDYHAFTSSSPLGPYTDQGYICAYVPAYPGYTGTFPYSAGAENLNFVQSDTNLWRVYYHDDNNDPTGNGAAISWWWEESPTPFIPSSWSAPVYASLKDTQVSVLSVDRTNDEKTMRIIAAAARQNQLPFNLPRGGAVCDGDLMRTPYTGGPYGGDCYGLEHLGATQSADGMEELRIMAAPGSRIHFGNYTSLTNWLDWGYMDAAGLHTTNSCPHPFAPSITISAPQTTLATPFVFTIPTTPAITVTLPANCAGSTWSDLATATGATTITVKHNGTAVCTGTVAASGSTLAWGTGGTATTFAGGDVMSISYSGDNTLTGGLTINACYLQ